MVVNIQNEKEETDSEASTCNQYDAINRFEEARERVPCLILKIQKYFTVQI